MVDDASPPAAMQWIKTLELGYSDDSDESSSSPDAIPVCCCFYCGKALSTPLKCGRCRVAAYCQRECQVQDWKQKQQGGGGHKAACPSYQRLLVVTPTNTNETTDDAIPTRTLVKLKTDQDRQDARAEIFARVRFYICPYAVTQGSRLGRGFLFIQSDHTLAMLSLAKPQDCFGRWMGTPATTTTTTQPAHSPNSNLQPPRSLLIHYLTLGEYDAEICRDDFELAMVRTELQQAVADYDEQKEVLLLMRFRCGHVALGTAPLVPDYRVCQKLGQDYFGPDTAVGSGGGALQLNLDDVV